MIQVLVKQNGKWVVKKELDLNMSKFEQIMKEIEILRSYGYKVDVRVTTKPSNT